MHKKTSTMVDIIERLLKKSEISQKTAAKEMGFDQSALNKIMTGSTENPGIERVKAIAKYLGVTVSQLLGETPMGNSDQLDAILSIDFDYFKAACDSVDNTIEQRKEQITDDRKKALIREVYIHLKKNNPKDITAAANLLSNTLFDIL